MPTWQDQFHELATEQSVVLEKRKKRKRADLKDKCSIETGEIRKTMAAMTEFLKKYEAAGSPDRDEEMPNN